MDIRNKPNSHVHPLLFLSLENVSSLSHSIPFCHRLGAQCQPICSSALPCSGKNRLACTGKGNNVFTSNFLQAYTSIFNFMQCYKSKSSKSSSFSSSISSVRTTLYGNFKCPADCKD